MARSLICGQQARPSSSADAAGASSSQAAVQQRPVTADPGRHADQGERRGRQRRRHPADHPRPEPRRARSASSGSIMAQARSRSRRSVDQQRRARRRPARQRSRVRQTGLDAHGSAPDRRTVARSPARPAPSAPRRPASTSRATSPVGGPATVPPSSLAARPGPSSRRRPPPPPADGWPRRTACPRPGSRPGRRSATTSATRRRTGPRSPAAAGSAVDQPGQEGSGRFGLGAVGEEHELVASVLPDQVAGARPRTPRRLGRRAGRSGRSARRGPTGRRPSPATRADGSPAGTGSGPAGRARRAPAVVTRASVGSAVRQAAPHPPRPDQSAAHRTSRSAGGQDSASRWSCREDAEPGLGRAARAPRSVDNASAAARAVDNRALRLLPIHPLLPWSEHG